MEKEQLKNWKVKDPTENVMALVAAGMSRQDDLLKAAATRADDLRDQAQRFNEHIRQIHLDAQRELMLAEAKRIDAITLAESRRIDALLAAATNAVALASEKAGAQAATLAQQVATSAEALRAQVAATSAATTMLITQLRESVEKRLTALEQNQYQAGGASAQREAGQKRSEWSTGLIVAIIFGVVAMFGTVGGLLLKLLGHGG